MWWERLGVAPIRPGDAQKTWQGANLALSQLTQLEKAVKAASAAKAVGWWLGPWQPAAKGHRATLTVYFAKKNQAEAFLVKPPAPVVKTVEDILLPKTAATKKSVPTKRRSAAPVTARRKSRTRH